MNLHRLLKQRAAAGRPVRVGLVGAGKFGSMFLAQALRTEGLHVVGVADLSVERARRNMLATGWASERISAASPAKAMANGGTCILDDPLRLIDVGGLDVVIEATGVPEAGIRHAQAAIAEGRHVVMVNVEADVLAGPLLAKRAAAAGCVYSLAYGDQPALICEQVDWARACGFEVVCAGKGTKYLPEYHASTPETVWKHYGLTSDQAEKGGMNPQMFNSFLDGTKSAIEMAAVANACDLSPPGDGLLFPPCGTHELPSVLRPKADGGVIEKRGMVEVVSSLTREGEQVKRDLRWGVYVTLAAGHEYVKRCFGEYGLTTDDSGTYTALFRPCHMIGLELGISVASAALRREATGAPRGFVGDVAAVAKRDLAAGERLDGEGGQTVWGKLLPAARSRAIDALPIGLAHGVRLNKAVRAGNPVGWSDVDLDFSSLAVRTRREMEAEFPVPH